MDNRIEINKEMLSINSTLPNDGVLCLENLKFIGSVFKPILISKKIADNDRKRKLIVNNCSFNAYKYCQMGYSKELYITGTSFSNACGVNQGEGYGLLIGHTNYAEIKQCLFYNNQRHGLYAGTCGKVIIQDNVFKKHRRFFGEKGNLSALNIGRGTKNAVVERNLFEQCESLGLNISSDTLSDSPLIESVVIRNNIFKSNIGGDIKIGQTKNANREVTINEVKIINNRFFNSSKKPSINVYNGNCIIIKNNFFNSNNNNTIIINNTKGMLKKIEISNNTFEGKYNNAIYVSARAVNNDTKIIIKDNVYSGNGNILKYGN